ncbi:MAG TPA: HAMP domain-containing histidine kinase [Sneathiellales bacterium]|nr:HAMP domain-containing histidine kinase [Sneathiellales bacterium]
MTVWELVLEDRVHSAIFGHAFPLATGERWAEILAVILAIFVSVVVLFIFRSRADKTEQDGLRLNQARLARAQKQAETANQAKSEFLSSMSHELRTPMNAILGFAQLLEQDKSGALSETHSSFVEEILRSGHHMMELINGVLDLAKIESGRMAYNIEEFEPRILINRCLKMVKASADQEGVEIKRRFPEGALPEIRVDNLRFSEAMLNLLSNAIKYNRPGGEVIVECKNGDDREIRITASDNGAGLPDEMQGKVFEPFDRLGAETSDIPGTGIGLTVTKQLIEGMQGRVGFESIVGEGSTFWIDLPVANPLIDAEETTN